MRFKMSGLRAVLVAFLMAFWPLLAAGQPSASAGPQPTHRCDEPLPGWDVLKTIELADRKDGPPHSKGPAGDWYVTRVTKWIPYCQYHNPIGLYSLDTYALAPRLLEEEVQICAAAPGGGSRPVAPFTGPCPPTR
jgi:hypothetical protein